MSKKPYLVDVPVKINVWIRPECQKQQFEVIKMARPSILFILSDGGRNKDEWDAIYENRNLIDKGIDWECTVYRLYETVNNGLYKISKKAAKLIWSKVDRCIFLEDDQIPSVSYFEYCAELLEKYKNDQRIECICGMNHLGIYNDVNTDYFFARQGSIWGTATWKRVYDEYDIYAYGKDPYIMKLLRQRTKKNPIAWKRLSAYANSPIYEGHVAGSEFWIEFSMYSQNRLQIIPKKNLISNIGCTVNSAHADSLLKMPKGIRKVFGMRTYELEFPLKHPDYVIPDIFYEKKRNHIMGYNDMPVKLYRTIEMSFIHMKSGDFGRWLKRKVTRKIGVNNELEK